MISEEDARAKVAAIAGPAMSRIERFASLLIEENQRQNLISRASEAQLWQRHLLDSIQLSLFVRAEDRTLVDVGSGPGLPGLVLAALDRWDVLLVEPRRRRAEFLEAVVKELSLTRVDVAAAAVETMALTADVITARAVAPVAELLAITQGCSAPHTRYILPKGRSASTDVDLARQQWHGVFHVEQSLTDPDGGIVIADRVSRR